MSPSFSGSPGAARESMVCCDAAAVIRGGYSVLLRRDKHLPRLPHASRTVTPQRNHVHLGHPAPPRTPLAVDPGRQPQLNVRPPLGGARAPLARPAGGGRRPRSLRRRLLARPPRPPRGCGHPPPP